MEEKNKKKKVQNENKVKSEEDTKKEKLMQEKQMNNLLSRINYLQIDNKKLKEEIESLKKTTNKDLQDQLQAKINEI